MSIIPIWARIAIVAALVAMGFGVGWKVNGWRLGTDLQALKNEHAQTVADSYKAGLAAQQKADADHDKLAGKIAAIDATNHDNFVRFEHENTRLAAGADAGTVSVRVVGANCPASGDVPQAASGSSVDSGAGAELGGDARRRYFALREALGSAQNTIAACQQSLREMTGQR